MSPLHIGDPEPDDDSKTYCGLPIREVDFWAAPDVAGHMTFTRVCGNCARARHLRMVDGA